MVDNERLPNDTVLRNRYKILGEPGRGGMGFVYRAYDLRDSRTVAIKEMRQSGFTAEELAMVQRSFVQEVEILKKLTPHPHIPDIYDCFNEDGHSYFVMQFIEGKTLKQLVTESPTHQLPVIQVLNYAMQLCTALSHLHRQPSPVIFRDLKPDNVMVTPEGRVYLIDFGIARIFKPEKLADTDIFRSPGFAAPELFPSYAHLQKGKRIQTDPRSDLYSMGATLHYCLTGRNPAQELFYFPSVSGLCAQTIPDGLDHLIHWLVATRKKRRPKNVDIVQRELLEIQSNAQENTAPLASARRRATEYYHAPTARNAQRTIRLARLNKLPGVEGQLWDSVVIILAWIGSLVLLVGTGIQFCKEVFKEALQTIGEQTVNVGSKLRDFWNQLREGQPQSPQRPRNGNEVRLFARVVSLPGIVLPLLPLPLPSHLAPFIGLFLFTAGGSISWLVLFHFSPYVVLFALAVILLLFVFMCGLREKVALPTQSILATIMIAMMVVGGAFLTQPDVQFFVSMITLRNMLTWSLLALGCVSVFRSSTRSAWTDHLAVSCAAIFAAVLQITLGPLEMPSGIALPIDVVLAIVLAILSFFSLSRFSKPFTRDDKFLISCITLFPFVLQIMLGTHDLALIPISFPWSSGTFNALLLVILAICLCIAFFTPNEPSLDEQRRGAIPARWLRLGRLPVLLVIIMCLLLLLLSTSDSSNLSLGFLNTRLLDLASTDQGLVGGLFLLALFLMYCLIRKSSFIAVQALESIAVAGAAALFLAAPNSQALFFFSDAHLGNIQILGWNALFVLGFTIASTIAHLVLSPDRNTKIVAIVDGLLRLLVLSLIGFSLIACLLLITTLRDIGQLVQFITNAVQQGPFEPSLILPLIGVAVVIWKLLCTGILLLRVVFTTYTPDFREGEEDEHEPGATGFKRVWLALKNDSFVMLIVTVTLLTQWYLSGKPPLEHLSFLFGSTQIRLPWPSWFIIGSLVVAVGASLFWLQRPFESDKLRLLTFLLVCAGVGIVVACIGMLNARLVFLFITGVAADLILLIQAMLVAFWAEEELRTNPRHAPPRLAAY